MSLTFHLRLVESNYPPVPQGIKVAFMCELYDVLELGDSKSVLLEAKSFYIADEIYTQDLNFLPQFIGRVGRIYKSPGSQIFLQNNHEKKD